MREAFGRDVVSERRACQVLGQPRSTQRRQRHAPSDEPRLVERMIELASQYGRYGYRRVTAMLRDEGFQVNHKRLERLWRREGLKVPKKQPKRKRLWLNDGSCVRLRPAYRDHVWSYDFMRERTSDGRAYRILTLIDEYSRECLSIDVGRRLGSEEVLERLTWLMATRSVPAYIRSENGYNESFNGKLRDELLAMEIFDTLLEAKVLIERWRGHYNTIRPHSSLDYRPPTPEAIQPWAPGSGATPLRLPPKAEQGQTVT